MDVRRSARPGGTPPAENRVLAGVPGSPRLAVTLILTYVLYVTSVRGLAAVVVPPENLSLFWLANAIVVVALLVTERRCWWAVWAVAMAAELTADSLLAMPMGVALWWGVVNIVESTLVVLLLRRLAGPGDLMRTVRSVGVFVAVALAVPALTAVLGAAGSVVAYDAGWFNSWRAWWFGDALGITSGVPLGLAALDVRSSVVAARSRQVLLVFAAVLAIGAGVAGVLVATDHLQAAQNVVIAGGIVAGLGLGAIGAAVGAATAAVVELMPSVLDRGDVSVVPTQVFLQIVTAALLFVGGSVEAEHRTIRALRRSEERFRTTFDDAPIGMAITDLSSGRIGRWTRVNQALAATWGRTSAELLALDPSTLVHPDDLGDEAAQLATGAIERIETERRYLHADGRYRWCRVVKSVVRVPGETGTPYAITQIGDITAAKDGVAQLEHAAFHDPLTGLPNRLLFMDRLGHSLAELDRDGGMVAVLYVDLDGFKTVNDTLGHDAGDAVLVEVAGRLRRGTRPGDTVGRLGGDEFAVVCGGLHGDDDVAELVQRLRGELDGPAAVAGRRVPIVGSIGVATTGHPGDDTAELLREADAAMFAQKATRSPDPSDATGASGRSWAIDGGQVGSTASPRVK